MERGQRRSEPAQETTTSASARRGFAMVRGAGSEGSAPAPGRVHAGEGNSPSGVSVASVLLTCRFVLFCFVFKCEDLRLTVGFSVRHRTPRRGLARGVASRPLPSPRVEAPERGCDSRYQGVGKAPSIARHCWSHRLRPKGPAAVRGPEESPWRPRDLRGNASPVRGGAEGAAF